MFDNYKNFENSKDEHFKDFEHFKDDNCQNDNYQNTNNHICNLVKISLKLIGTLFVVGILIGLGYMTVHNKTINNNINNNNSTNDIYS